MTGKWIYFVIIILFNIFFHQISFAQRDFIIIIDGNSKNQKNLPAIHDFVKTQLKAEIQTGDAVRIISSGSSSRFIYNQLINNPLENIKEMTKALNQIQLEKAENVFFETLYESYTNNNYYKNKQKILILFAHSVLKNNKNEVFRKKILKLTSIYRNQKINKRFGHIFFLYTTDFAKYNLTQSNTSTFLLTEMEDTLKEIGDLTSLKGYKSIENMFKLADYGLDYIPVETNNESIFSLLKLHDSSCQLYIVISLLLLLSIVLFQYSKLNKKYFSGYIEYVDQSSNHPVISKLELDSLAKRELFVGGRSDCDLFLRGSYHLKPIVFVSVCLDDKHQEIQLNADCEEDVQFIKQDKPGLLSNGDIFKITSYQFQYFENK